MVRAQAFASAHVLRYRTLTIEPPVLRGDTLFTHVSVGTQWRCGRAWRGHGIAYEGRITRHCAPHDRPPGATPGYAIDFTCATN